MTLSLFQRVCFQTGAHQTHLSCPRKRKISRAGTFVSMATSLRTNTIPLLSSADFDDREFLAVAIVLPRFFFFFFLFFYRRITFESDKTSLSRSFKIFLLGIMLTTLLERSTFQCCRGWGNGYTRYTFLVWLVLDSRFELINFGLATLGEINFRWKDIYLFDFEIYFGN